MVKNKFSFVIFIFLFYLPLVLEGKELTKCEWKNIEGIPCFTIFSSPNASGLAESLLDKVIITKKQLIDSEHNDVRSVLENILGLDVFSNGPSGQNTSVFIRGMNSNHTLVLLNGIPINDQGSPKAQFDFGYDFLHGLQQIEVYKGASGAIFGPGSIGGAINFITDIDYENSFLLNGSEKKNNSISGNYTFINEANWHHNIKGGFARSEKISATNSKPDLDGMKNLTLNYNIVKFLSDNLKFKGTSYIRKTESEYDVSNYEDASATNAMYVIQSSLENKIEKKLDSITAHMLVHDRIYNEDVKNKYYSQSYVLKAERKIDLTNSLSYGFGGDYKYDKGDFIINGPYGSSAKGHSDNKGFFSNLGYKFNENTLFSFHVRGDSHKYSDENITYKINAAKILNKLKLSLSESTSIRHPDLYVLHGNNANSSFYNGSFKSMLTTKPEKSLTREISMVYKILENISFESTAYKGSVSDVLNRSDSIGGYNETIDIKQKGLESSLTFQNINGKISLNSSLSKSTEGNGKPQLRRPQKQFGINYNTILNSDYIGLFGLNLNYKYTGNVEDWVDSERKKIDSTDVINISLSKTLFGVDWKLSGLNLTDEKFQRPHGYNQERRRFNLSVNIKY